MEVQTPGQAFAAFLGALGFTRPVEQLELHSVPLPSLYLGFLGQTVATWWRLLLRLRR